jgi:hypothetical protein
VTIRKSSLGKPDATKVVSMVSPLAATQWPVPVPPDCEVKVSVLVSETFPISETFPVPLVVIVGAAMVSFPWNEPLKGTFVCAAAVVANAAVRIIAPIGKQILHLVVVFICAPWKFFDQAAGSYPAHLPRIRIHAAEGYSAQRPKS